MVLGVNISLLVLVSCLTVSLLIYTSYLWIIRKLDENKQSQDIEKSLKGESEKVNSELALQDQIEYLAYNTKYEIKRENLTYGKDLGSGAFGKVSMAIVKGIPNKVDETTVAVKSVTDMGNYEVWNSGIFKILIMNTFIHWKYFRLIGKTSFNRRIEDHVEFERTPKCCENAWCCY